MRDGLVLAGYLDLEKRDATGKVIEKREVKNLIVNTGKTLIAKMVGHVAGTTECVDHIEIGCSGTAVNVTQVGLVGYSYDATVTPSYEADYTLKMVSVFASGVFPIAGINITEAGTFSGATPSGTMISRQTFDAINLTSTDNLTVTWRLIIS